MGLVARYIDALSDGQRDNVIEAKEFTDGNQFVDCGIGCLVGVAEMNLDRSADRPIHMAMADIVRGRMSAPGYNFPRLCDRFGKDRVIAACKARAARGNSIHEIRAEIYEELTPREVMAWREGKARRLVPDGGMYGSTLITSGDTDA